MSLTESPTSSRVVDEQFLERTNHRLSLVSGGFAGVVGSLVLTSALLYGPLGWAPPHHLNHFLIAQSILFLLSLGVAIALWRRAFSPRAGVKLGLAYQVGGACVISSCAFYGDMLVQPVMVRLSWLGVWILLFPLLVPSPPRRSLAVSLLCATTAPAVFLLWSARHGGELPAFPVLLDTFLPYYLCAGLAVIPAWLVYDFRAAVSTAREQVRRLGSYLLLERLGQGGMGEVWRAEHSLLARPAAIKLIRPESLGAGEDPALRSVVLTGFEREAKATAALTSPHTVSLFDYGVTEEGTLYYAMELLDGLDLESLVERYGPVAPNRAVYLLRQVCESLSEAHRAGLVHGDIKPSNLMVCSLGGRRDFVKVLDFGLVRRTDAQDEPTDAGYVAGTPAFMAPELVSTPDVTDARADLYALGCVAYWLVTGRFVFGDEKMLVVDVLAGHARSEPPRPSERAGFPIPALLEELILACLEKDPARRPQSAEEIERRLAAVPLEEPWTHTQAQSWWQAHVDPSQAPPKAEGAGTETHRMRPEPIEIGTFASLLARAKERARARADRSS